MVTVSHAHEGHSSVKGFRGSPRVIDSPGEYEIGGVFVTGVPTFHDNQRGKEQGQNTAFLFDFDGLTVCHLGDLGHVLTQEQVEALDGVNVLLVPVGGISTITPAKAAEVVSILEPNIVIPMHYKTRATSRKLGSLSRFLKVMGVDGAKPQDSLRITLGSLPEETRVVVLNYA
jgi:L-ascorbate metabolism protein UlaG (beta-lactamase superfamily)